MTPGRRPHRPQRTCVQCRAKKGKEGLFRLAGRPGKGWEPDPGAVRPGRGIYLCRDTGCIERFAQRIRTQKGAARWKMGRSAEELADRLEARLSGG